jgi:hypothetical protein
MEIFRKVHNEELVIHTVHTEAIIVNCMMHTYTNTIFCAAPCLTAAFHDILPQLYTWLNQELDKNPH